MKLHFALAAGLAAVVAAAPAARAAEVTLISVGGVKVAIDPIIADYTKQTGNTVKYIVGSPLAVSQKLAAGEVYDVVVQSAPAMADFAKQGGLNSGGAAKVARGGIGMAVAKEATAPDISTPDAFKRALANAKSIAMTDTAMPNGSGGLTQAIFEKAGVVDVVKPKLKVVGLDPGQQQIAKGEIEIGFFNNSEIRPFVKYAGSVPAPLQQYTVYEAALTAKAPAADAGAALLKMIQNSDAHWTQARLDPLH
jgi:molybdate transport system substrate-binding protein